MTNSMNAWFPALYLKNEAEKRGLDASELNTTIAMTMMLKGSPVMNMFLADSGLKRVEAEAELSKKRTELTKVNTNLNVFKGQLKEFHDRLEDGEFGEFVIGIVEFMLQDDDKVKNFKEKIRGLEDQGAEEFEEIKVWLGLSGLENNSNHEDI